MRTRRRENRRKRTRRRRRRRTRRKRARSQPLGVSGGACGCPLSFRKDLFLVQIPLGVYGEKDENSVLLYLFCSR